MTDPCEDVKPPRGTLFTRTKTWIDCHPRTGWYLVSLLSFNTVLNLLDLLMNAFS